MANEDEEALVEDSEQTVVIEESQEAAMDVIESEETDENTVYQQEVCDTPITVNVETGSALTEAHEASQSIQVQSSDVVPVNAHTIIVTEAVEEQL